MAETAAYSVRGYSGSAAATTLSAGITAADTTITVTSGASYAGLTNFRITINQGESTEEEVEVASVSGNTFQNCVRGVGGTTAAAHASGETVEHTSSKRDFEEANYAVSETVGKITAANQLLVSDAANSLAALDVAASRIVGRAAAGNVDDLTVAQVKTLLAYASADISDLAETIRDTIGSALTAGAGITLTVNDAGDTITVASTTTGVDRLWIPPSDLFSIAGTPVVAGTAGSSQYPGMAFDAAAVERATFAWVVPNGWSNVSIKYWWSSAGGAGNVLWENFYRAVSGDGAAISGAVSSGSYATALDANTAANTMHVFEVRTIAALTPGVTYVMGVGRAGTDGTDTNASDAFLHGIELVGS